MNWDGEVSCANSSPMRGRQNPDIGPINIVINVLPIPIERQVVNLFAIVVILLSHDCLMTPYGDKDLGLHWLR